MSQDVYNKITNTFVQQLEQGVRMWHQPWQSKSAGAAYKIPMNAVTGKEYRGYNILSLWFAASEFGYSNNQYATYKQWASEGEFVRKDEKGNMIVFYDVMEKEDDKHEIKKIPFLKVSHVFNRDQLKSFDPAKIEQPEPTPLFDRLKKVDDFIAGTGVTYSHEGDSAYYDRKLDTIVMPPPELFTGSKTQTAQESYYATLLHEMGHMTGHKKRLDRDVGKRFGDQAYAFEEIVAEITSAFQCAKLEITDAPRPDHAQYIGHWLDILKSDNRAILTAASMASKASDYLDNMHLSAAQPLADKPYRDDPEFRRALPSNDNCMPCVSQGMQFRRIS